MLPFSAAHAQSDDDVGKQLINEFVSDVRTMQAAFEQQLIDADDVVIETSSGNLEIARPGKFRWHYSDPYEQILVADGINVWSYDVDLEQVTVKPQAEALGSTPAILLGGSSDVLQEFEYIGSFSERDTTWVILAPKTTEHGFTRIELGFVDRKLSRMIFSDNLGQSTLIALFKVETDLRFDDDHFTLAVPEGVDVIGQPLVPDQADQ